MTQRNVRKQGWVFTIFSPDSDDRLSLSFHRFVILYRSCDTRSVGLGQYCLPKVSNGFNRTTSKLNVKSKIHVHAHVKVNKIIKLTNSTKGFHIGSSQQRYTVSHFVVFSLHGIKNTQLSSKTLLSS